MRRVHQPVHNPTTFLALLVAILVIQCIDCCKINHSSLNKILIFINTIRKLHEHSAFMLFRINIFRNITKECVDHYPAVAVLRRQPLLGDLWKIFVYQCIVVYFYLRKEAILCLVFSILILNTNY